MWPCRSGKRLLHTALLQERCKCGGSILLAAVAVKCQIGRGISFAESYPKCTGDQIRAGIAGYAIADDFPGKEVENDAQIKPVIVELEVCNITDPCLIRMFCGKLLLQQVLLAVFLMLFKLLFGIKSNAAQIELLHDRSNALGADSDTTFGQCNANLFGTIPLAAVVESLLYQTHELCLLLVALAAVRTAKDVVVKCTASDIQCFAQLMNTISIIRLMVEIFQNGKSLLQGNNRLAFFLERANALPKIKRRIERYYDELVIDEIQDIGGRDFDFLESLMDTNVNMLFVGDFYQHTFDTSRDGNKNKTLFDDKIKYESRFTAKGIVCDNTSLLNSWRCSKNVCQFITDNLGIRIGSNRADEDNTTIEVVTDSVRIAEYTRNNSIVKLHYQNGSKKGICIRTGERQRVKISILMSAFYLIRLPQRKWLPESWPN